MKGTVHRFTTKLYLSLDHDNITKNFHKYHFLTPNRTIVLTCMRTYNDEVLVCYVTTFHIFTTFLIIII